MRILIRNTVALFLVFAMIFTLGISSFTEGGMTVIEDAYENEEIKDEDIDKGDIGSIDIPSSGIEEGEGLEENDSAIGGGGEIIPGGGTSVTDDVYGPSGGIGGPKDQYQFIEIEAIPNKDSYYPGETLEYEIIIRNIVAVDLEDLIIGDDLNGPQEIDLLEAGEELTLQRSYLIDGDFREEILQNRVYAYGEYGDLEVYDETDFTVYIEKMEEVEELAENIPPVMYDPEIVIPEFLYPNFRSMSLMRTNSQSDVITSKTAERFLGLCRAYEITLGISGEPQQAPIDLVLIIDRSGSMNESSERYVPITSAPNTNQSYYIKVGNNYQTVSYNTGSNNNPAGWRYGNSSNRRYVSWNPNGNDIDAGSTNSNSPLGKPFYLKETGSRLYYAKQAAVNFAAKVLGTTGIPGSRVSVVSFSGPTTTSGNGAQNQANTDQNLTTNLNLVTSAINGLSAGGGTNTQAGFLQGKTVVENSGNPSSRKVVVMLSDGQPTASNGVRYAEPTTTNHAHIQNAISAGQSLFGLADVYTVGLLQGMNNTDKNLALHVLNNTNNKGFYEAPTAQDIDDIFNTISTQLQAVVEDKIGDNFDLITNSLPTGATYDPTTRIITWNPGATINGAELKYKVRARSSFESGMAYTNEYAKLTYTDSNGQQVIVDFDKPEVDVPALLKLELQDQEVALGQALSLGLDMIITGGDAQEGYPEGIVEWKWEKVGDSTWTSNQKNPSVSLIDDSEFKLTITDSNGCKAVATMKVTVHKGTITIKKEITNYKAKFANKKFDIIINGPGGKKWTVSLKHNESKTIEGLAIGLYTITEIVPMNFKLVSITNSSVQITQNNLDHNVLVKNIRSNDGWFYDEDERVNTFSGIQTVITQTILPEPFVFQKEQDFEQKN